MQLRTADALLADQDDDVESSGTSSNHIQSSNDLTYESVASRRPDRPLHLNIDVINGPSLRPQAVNFDADASLTSRRFVSSSYRTASYDITRSNMTDSENRRGSINLLSMKYESLDYDVCENTLYLEEQKKFGYHLIYNQDIIRWIIIFFIGVLTAITGSVIVMCVDILSDYKYGHLKQLVDKCVTHKCMERPLLVWLAYNAVPVALGSLLVTVVAPVAAGSGIPAIKCYLNGVKIPEVVRIKTFLTKFLSVTLSVVGGLACGKEGPMIHCGAVIAAGISQGKSTTFNKDLKVFQSFREDREKRDFVSAGAAAGVAAAFGAPVGGVLFSLEEGASFWNQALTWRIFFCSMISTFTLNTILSAYHHHPFLLSYSGLVNFGQFSNFTYRFWELPLYILIGAMGGLLGAFFNYTNHKLTVFRMRYIHAGWVKILESAVFAMITASVAFLLICYNNDCQKLEGTSSNISYPVQYNCPDGEFSLMAALWFNTPEASVKALFHNTWQLSATTLAVFFVCYFLLSIGTYGLSISSGIFIPLLLAGAAGGRLLAVGAKLLLPHDEIDLGKYALIGAAALLGGVVRMTISLTVILIEATGNITFGLPLMITLMVAKWVGDYFTEGLYDIHIQLASVPLLGWEPPPLTSNVYASEVMSRPVITLQAVEKVGHIVDVLIREPHNGFPVVDFDCFEEDSPCTSMGVRRSFGRFRGLILRWQLIILLQEKLFIENSEKTLDNLTLQTFRNAYPRYPSIHSVISLISDRERNYRIDLRPIMNPSCYSVSHAASLPRIFRLFRALGLRHLVVVNDRNEVIGIVTRKDLARFRTHYHDGKMSIQQLQISS